MDDKEYIKQRLDMQENWYSEKAKKNQSWLKRLQVIQMVCGASIPFLAIVIENQNALNITTGAVGVLIAVISGFIAVNKFDEKWINYRTTAELLKHEKFLYETGVTPYDCENPFSLLVQRVESVLSKENQDWSHYIKSENINYKKNKANTSA